MSVGFLPRADPKPPGPRRRKASHRFPGGPRGESSGETGRRHQARRPRPGCLRHAQTARRASSHSRCCLCHCRLVSTGQSNGELSELTDPAIDSDRAAMLLGHDVIADREAEASAFTRRLGREERLKELVFDLRWDTDAIVADSDFDHIAEIARRHPQSRLEVRVASLPLAFSGGIEAITEKVQTDTGNILGYEFDWGCRSGVIALQRDVEALI